MQVRLPRSQPRPLLCEVRDHVLVQGGGSYALSGYWEAEMLARLAAPYAYVKVGMKGCCGMLRKYYLVLAVRPTFSAGFFLFVGLHAVEGGSTPPSVAP